MNAYPLIAKLPSDAVIDINFFLADSAQRTIYKYYNSNPRIKYRLISFKWAVCSSVGNTLRVWVYCLRRSKHEKRGGYWTELASSWETFLVAYRRRVSVADAVKYVNDLFPEDN